MAQKSANLPVKQAPLYPYKLSKGGGTRTLAVGRFLPKDWCVVKVVLLKLEGDECVLKLTKIM